MPLDANTIVSLIGTLGFGSVIGQWAGASKATSFRSFGRALNDS
jgi:hypothetical protein